MLRNIEHKIEEYNRLKNELESVFGSFNSIEIVDEYSKDSYEEDGIHYSDTSACSESVPICVEVKRGYITKCANCGKEINTEVVFCNGDDERICQECWDNG